MATYTYDPTLLANPTSDNLRLRLGDTDVSQIATTPRSAFFANEELNAFYAANSGDYTFATCMALMAMANNKARLSAFVTLQGGGSVNLQGISAELRAQAKEIREQYINTPAFSLINLDVGDFSARNIIANAIQQQSS